MRERRKRIDIVRLTIYIIAVLAISGMAYATTYDFSSGEGVDKWAYEGYDDNSPSAVPPENETPLSSGEITAISASDTNRASYTPGSSVPSKYHFHRFKFKIKEEVSDILKLYVMYEGYGDFDLGGDGVQLYIWNYCSGPSGQWESIGYHTNGYDTIIEKDYMSGF